MGLCLLIACGCDAGLEGTFGDAHSEDLVLWRLASGEAWSGQGKVCCTVEHLWRPGSWQCCGRSRSSVQGFAERPGTLVKEREISKGKGMEEV